MGLRISCKHMVPGVLKVDRLPPLEEYLHCCEPRPYYSTQSHSLLLTKTFATMGFMLKAPAGTPGSAAPAIMIGLFVAFGGVLFGYVTTLSVSQNNLLTSTVMIPVPLVVFLV